MQDLQNSLFLSLVFDCVSTDEGMVAQKAKHAICMVNDATSFIRCFEGDSTISHFAELVPLSDKIVYDFRATSF